MKPKIYITRKIPAEIVSKLEEFCEINMWEEEEKPVPRDILEKEIADVEGIFCMLTESIDAELLAKAKNLKVVSNMAVGYNNIDIQEAQNRGVMVTNTPDVLTETTADLTFSLLMATARRLVEASNYLRNGKWETWSPMQLTGQDIYGATLGIIGMGRIGEAVARRAKGFSMNILYHNRNRKVEAEQELELQYVELDELLKASDYIVLMVPYTAETKYLIGERELKMMKKTSILINTARGGIVDEEALFQTLKSGEIWGVGVRDNIAFPLIMDRFKTWHHIPVVNAFARRAIARRPEVAGRVEEVAEMLELTQYLSRRPKALSGGQRQRVAVARALVRDPSLYLLDEPLSNLDAKLRAQMRAEITALHQRVAKTFVYVTHDQVEAMTMATRIIVLDNGVVQQIGTPQEVYDRPANVFVAKFVGSPPMNLLDVSVESGRVNVSAGSQSLPIASPPPDGDYVVGLRPENISIIAAGSNTITGYVATVENLGGETVVGVQWKRPFEGGVLTEGDAPAIVYARVPGTVRFDVGTAVGVSIDSDVSWFDGDSGVRLDLEQASTKGNS